MPWFLMYSHLSDRSVRPSLLSVEIQGAFHIGWMGRKETLSFPVSWEQKRVVQYGHVQACILLQVLSNERATTDACAHVRLCALDLQLGTGAQKPGLSRGGQAPLLRR